MEGLLSTGLPPFSFDTHIDSHIDMVPRFSLFLSILKMFFKVIQCTNALFKT